jgi:uncharacterized protein (TIGR03435 family)
MLCLFTSSWIIASAQAPATQARFDVASIKRNTSGSIGFSVDVFKHGQARMLNVSARALLYRSYDITADTPVLGLPNWADSERYDIVVKSDAMPTPAEQRQMWRSLLVERFEFRAPDESRARPIYRLVLARPEKGAGPGLAPSMLTCADRTRTDMPDVVAFLRQGPKSLSTPQPVGADNNRGTLLTSEFVAERLKTCGQYSEPGSLISGSMTLAALAQYLTPQAGRLVVDETGLPGAYSVRMISAPGDGGSLFTVLQEQLGLKLEPARAAARVLVIDHIDRPSEN